MFIFIFPQVIWIGWCLEDEYFVIFLLWMLLMACFVSALRSKSSHKKCITSIIKQQMPLIYERMNMIFWNITRWFRISFVAISNEKQQRKFHLYDTFPYFQLIKYGMCPNYKINGNFLDMYYSQS